ncbi:hypothetical protein [Clostridium cylindrosporum]|uniref:Uncharacterized protein n=1 Tax=Clostridium cylindrosporum DSM 605 TaxID=1121307 RepID=A0A0J8DAK4_CLOCY|nr:hypothetical protein [Clostridium cylindrosporum]KMT22877.1 hypothetical protein CLCY_5c01160 [Clostridium cylindrosporum DSM 605]
MIKFTLPRDVCFEKDSFKFLKTMKGSKGVSLLGEELMKKTIFVDSYAMYIREASLNPPPTI